MFFLFFFSLNLVIHITQAGSISDHQYLNTTCWTPRVTAIKSFWKFVIWLSQHQKFHISRVRWDRTQCAEWNFSPSIKSAPSYLAPASSPDQSNVLRPILSTRISHRACITWTGRYMSLRCDCAAWVWERTVHQRHALLMIQGGKSASHLSYRTPEISRKYSSCDVTNRYRRGYLSEDYKAGIITHSSNMACLDLSSKAGEQWYMNRQWHGAASIGRVS